MSLAAGGPFFKIFYVTLRKHEDFIGSWKKKIIYTVVHKILNIGLYLGKFRPNACIICVRTGTEVGPLLISRLENEGLV